MSAKNVGIFTLTSLVVKCVKRRLFHSYEILQ